MSVYFTMHIKKQFMLKACVDLVPLRIKGDFVCASAFSKVKICPKYPFQFVSAASLIMLDHRRKKRGHRTEYH